MPPPSVAVSSTTSTTIPPRKSLLFDRRYGWVLDDCKEPSEEAFTGGRGMFCIVPFAKELFQTAFESINFFGSTALSVLERPSLLPTKAIQAALSDEMHKITLSIKDKNPFSMRARRNNENESTSGSPDLID